MFWRGKDWRQVVTRMTDNSPRFLLGNLPRCKRHPLAMNPEPRAVHIRYRQRLIIVVVIHWSVLLSGLRRPHHLVYPPVY